MHYTIYKTTNLLNGKFYIGKHQTKNPNDSYFGSGVALKNSISKHGKKNFKKEILFDFDNEAEMNLKEAELITKELVARSDTYNAGIGGEGGAHFKGKKHSRETRERISKTQQDPDWQRNHPREYRVAANKGKKDSNEVRLRKSIAMKLLWKKIKSERRQMV